MDNLPLPQRILIWGIPVLLAIILHEIAHGWTAYKRGDPTAYQLGRLTLNPIKHIDPIGTVVLPLLLLYLGGFIFGWAKPVPINFNQLHSPKKDMILVAAAGPLANLLMAMGWTILIKAGLAFKPELNQWALFIVYMGFAGLQINLILMIFNLLPIPPLDGSRILAGLIPDRYSQILYKIEPYGLLIVMGLFFVGALSYILWPLIKTTQYFMMSLFNIPLSG